MRYRFLSFLVATFAAALCDARAEETLDALLDRGYAETWLVCGPFASGEPGIVARAQRRLLPLPDMDYFEPGGGVRQARPVAGASVATTDGERTWQEIQTRSERVELSDMLDGFTEGVLYAAVRVTAQQPANVLIDAQSMLGMRVWVNGFPVAMPAPVAPASAGLQRHRAKFRAGDNWVVVQVPVASLASVATAESLSPDALRETILATRPMLPSATGYEFAMRFRLAGNAGQLVYVPRLYDTGRFTGTGASLRQEFALELFNPGPGSAGPVAVRVRFADSDPWVEKVVRALPPNTLVENLVDMPIAGRAAGEKRVATIEIETPDAKSAFASRVTVRSSPARGTVYVVTGLTGAVHDGPQSETVVRRAGALARHLTLLEYEPAYGFHVGGFESWYPYFVAHPEQRTALGDAAVRGAVSVNAGYAVPDTRVVSGELLARDLLYGRHASMDMIGRAGGTMHAWRVRGVPVQWGRLLRQSQIIGVALSGELTETRRGASWLYAGRAGRLPVWSFSALPTPSNASGLREQATTLRETSVAAGLDAAVLPIETAYESAPAFVLNETQALRESVPSIRFDGDGPGLFFEGVREFGERNAEAFDELTDVPMTTSVGDVIAFRPLKDAYTKAENQLNAAERFAALAAFNGAAHPHAKLDWAWRQLLYYGEPGTLGRPATPRTFLDALTGFHGVFDAASGELDRALASIATRINTATDAPTNPKAVQALTVFNPSFHPRTDLCEMWLPQGTGTAWSLVDGGGDSVPHVLKRVDGGSIVQFLASDVSAFGYKTYFVVPGAPGSSSPGAANTIENEFFRIVVDPAQGGAIVNLEDKQTGTGLLGGLGNDVVVFDEDPASAGRAIAIVGAARRASDEVAQVQTLRNGVFEQIRIVGPLAGGELVRTITLVKGVEQIAFETELRGVNTQDRLVGIQFNAAPQEHTLVSGERFGMTVTGQGDIARGAHPRPALRWVALSPNDHVRAGANVAMPLQPVAIVYVDESYAAAARSLSVDLLKRGIPSVRIDRYNATSIEQSIDDGHRFLVVLGSAVENDLTLSLLNRLEPSARARAQQSIEAGLPIAFGRIPAVEGAPPVDALVLAGKTPADTEALINAVSKDVARTGAVELPPRNYFGPSPRPLPTRGLAVLFEGTHLAAHGDGGELLLLAAHDAMFDKAGAGVSVEPAPLDLALRYSLVPFDGDWRTANIPSQAHAYAQPLRAAMTGLHLGSLPPENAFASIDDRAFAVTAFKRAHATPGYLLRGYESQGNPVAAAFQSTMTPRRAWRTDAAERAQDPLPAGSGFRIELEPFSIASYGFETAQLRTPTEAVSAEGEIQFTRYWQHHAGAAPETDPVATLLLDGDLANSDTATLRVVNERDVPLQGTVQLAASPGWTLAPASLEVSLVGNEVLERRLLIVRPPAAPGGIAATLQTGERMYRDVLLTDSTPFEMSVEQGERELVVRVRNNVALELVGGIEVIVPSEAWASSSANALVEPWRETLTIGPLDEHRAAFVWQGDGAARWYGVKVYGNGHTAYWTP